MRNTKVHADGRHLALPSSYLLGVEQGPAATVMVGIDETLNGTRPGEAVRTRRGDNGEVACAREIVPLAAGGMDERSST